jgi:dTMP kinase
MYIVLEWVVWAGKSTQAKLLHQYLSNKYPEKEVLLVREPGATPIAEAIRKTVQGTDFGDEQMHPLADAYLYAAARAQSLHTLVKPALERGAIVISDRSFVTSLVYQWYTQWLGIEKVRDMNQHAVQECLPDVVLFFDLPVEVGYSRTHDPSGDKWEKKEISFFLKVYEGYQRLFAFLPTKQMMCRIDASDTIEQVHRNIISAIEKLPG